MKPVQQSIKFFCFLLICGLAPGGLAQKPPLSLPAAIALAHQNDPWLEDSRLRQQATDAQAVVAGELPDPKMSVGFANLPVDSFDFSQEPMTQFKVGVSQSFPRGDTRHLNRQRLQEMAGQQPYRRQDRWAKVEVIVAHLWLETYRNTQAIRLIENDRSLFEHLVDVAESNYTSALGKTRQQDLVRAQLELTRLEDRLTKLRQQRETMQSKLGEWLPTEAGKPVILSDHLPLLSVPQQLSVGGEMDEKASLASDLLEHPALKALDQKIIAGSTTVELARQKYKPQWGVNASYSYRDDDPMAGDRSDFFSLGLSFDLPLFTSRRQDKDVHSAVAMAETTKVEKALVLRAMRANFQAALARLEGLNQRKTLFEERLLEEIHGQAEASLTAYTNDDGDFAEAVRARIAELNANIDFLNIEVDRNKTIVELNYFLVAASNDANTGSTPGDGL